MSAADRRVVITGMGLISPLGNSPESLWEAISTGRSGVDLIERIPMDHLPSDVGGEARQFTGSIDDFGELNKTVKRAVKKGLRLMCREIQMGVAASQLALAHSGWVPEQLDPARVGTLFGSDYIISEPSEFAAGIQACLTPEREFEFTQWGNQGRPQVEPLWLLKYLPNMPASHVAIYNDLRGPSNSITLREASSILAIAEATTTIRRGIADMMVAGATGSRIQMLRTIHVCMQERLADRHAAPASGDPARACRPYDADRTGMVMGEGAGILVLESLESATQRGVPIFGEVLGYGSSAVASPSGVANVRLAVSNALRAALRTADLSPGEIGHVHGHGLGDPDIDREEALAIQDVMGPGMLVTSAKSYMGNLGAGSGAVELIASLGGLRSGQIVGTLNYEQTDPECPVEVVAEARPAPSPVFVTFNVTPQGQAAAVVIRGAAA